MRTVHGQYRRKVKIPKDEVFGNNINESASDPPPEPVSPPSNPMPLMSTKKSPNKRKSSSPLKVKMPFKMASEKKTKEENNLENA